MISEAYNIDCMNFMKNIPDNYFDLSVVDPPYGDALGDLCGGGTGTDSADGLIDTKRTVCRTGGTWAEKYGKKS